MGITANRLHDLGLIDQVIGEPLGGAHRDFDQMAHSLKENLIENIEILDAVGIDKLLDQRYNRIMGFGAFIEY
jgi:acetyl-CoA carboxylase carboxyl transferase subunit alpha